MSASGWLQDRLTEQAQSAQVETSVKRWIVYTPEYGTVIPILDDGTGPLEYGADVVEVEAEKARDAIAFGVRLMLGDWHRYRYCRDQRSAGLSPYAGVKAEESILAPLLDDAGLDPELDPRPFANHVMAGQREREMQP